MVLCKFHKNSKEVKVFDVRGACCLEAAGLGKKLSELSPGYVLNVSIDRNMKEMASKIVEREKCEIIEAVDEDKVTNLKIHKKLKLKNTERKMENCMVCGGTLEHVAKAVEVACNYCSKKETSYIFCSKGHYVCDECHGKGAFDLIKGVALTASEKDPLAIAEILMAHPKIPFLGCEHALIATASFLAALKNEGSLSVSNEQIIEAMKRTHKQSMPPYCALTGVCGVPIGIGAAFSVILGAVCHKDRESAITMHVVARTIDTIANDVGPMCCKSFVRTAIGVGYNAAKEYLNVYLPIHREKISCFHSYKNNPNCKKEKCIYFPKTA